MTGRGQTPDRGHLPTAGHDGSRRGVHRHPLVQHLHHIADHPAHVLNRRVRAGGHVRREEDVVEAEQRVVGRRRLRVEYVDWGGLLRPAALDRPGRLGTIRL